ncbi:UNVERIFIED_CONTAM: hypothetical protein PYX00_008593 [Menopon gallinae]|uniref:CDT1 Geminin-binding domain-containing protein n=1 Tax=Menopon gallinae TaxID=328185 RepID=A0AAW2HNX2_9NEOP
MNSFVVLIQELSLKEVKDKLKQSAKLNELRKSINKINEQAAVLIELENKKKENSVPKLSKFKAIEVDVPLSPQKNALYSPSKVERSPGKLAYERYNFLAEASTTLPLPFSFQKLYELFQSVDIISSMMMNRGEEITFNKLKPAVQEMTRKTFTLRHLGQIAAVLPHAFNFRQEKVRNFGSTSKTDKYELVIKPTFPDAQGRPQAAGERSDIFHISDRMSMTPKVIKARKEAFYAALLNKTKDCHEEFLKSLDPPMEINRNDLKRWHPNFMVDHVPDVVPVELPQPPNSERPATAKEVLERAKDFLSSNARLQKALESASQSSDELRDITSRVSPAVKEKVDSKLSNPLKGIPKSLLEKVRARQAAKALDSMRMTPQQEKETVMYTRLPAIARIVRTLFVNEQRGVLSLDTVLEKVRFSYNRNLGKGEAESHVKLLVELLPEWLSVVHIRNTNYLKMNPAADLTSVMSKLDKIVSEKAKNT